MARPRKDRTERIPYGVARKHLTIDAATMKRLTVGKKKPRWINDVKNHIMEAQQGGYEFVEDTTRAAIKVGDNEEAIDGRICKTVGTHKDGSPMVAYLMAIPLKFYEEDQATKEEKNMKVDDGIRGGNPQGLQPHGVDQSMGETSVKRVQYRP